MKITQPSIVERLAGGLTVLVGTAVLLGWALDVPILKSVLPGAATMKVNTALCFILSGLAFWTGISERVAGTSRVRSLVCPALVMLACGLTLLESLFGWKLGLDEAILRDPTTAPALFPGRMAPNTAAAFVLLNTALLLLQGGPRRARRAAVGLLGAVTALFGLFAVLGWIGVIKLGYGWGELTGMALHSGALFVLLGSACAVHAWRQSGLSLVIGRRLLPGFAFVLVIFVALSMISYKSAQQLAETAGWVRHSHDVLTNLRQVESDLIIVQASVRGFVITGREDFLEPYRAVLPQLQDRLRTLRELTADNPQQQERMTALEEIIRRRLGFAEQGVGLYRQRGLMAAAAFISAAPRQSIMRNFESAIGELEQEEQELLDQREEQVRTQTASTFFVLSVGTFIGLGLLLAVLFILNSEAAERREAEATSRLAAEILASTSDGVITNTREGTITSWNTGAERIFGYTAQEAIGRSLQLLIPAESAEEEKEILDRIGRGERVEHFESVRLGKDGRRANISLTVSALKDHDGRILGETKIFCDITERKQAEEALRVKEERFRTMANSIPQLAWIAHADGSIYWHNERWYEYTGMTPESAEGRGWQSVHDPAVLPKVLENWTASIRSGQPFEMEYPLRGADRKFRTFLTRIQPLKDDEGRVVQWFGTNTDVDELKQMEASLRASQARLNSALSAGSIGTWTWDIVRDRLSADEFTARMFSIEADDAAKGLPAEAYLRAVLEEDRASVANHLGRAVESCGQYDIEYRVRPLDGELRWLQAKGRVEGDRAGKALTFHGAVMDITERKRIEEARRESEERLNFALEASQIGAWELSLSDQIIHRTPIHDQIFGHPELLPLWTYRTFLDHVLPEDRDEARQRFREATTMKSGWNFECRIRRADGVVRWIWNAGGHGRDRYGKPVRISGIVQDITERKRTDQALRESEEHFRFLNDLSEATRTLMDPAEIMAVTARMLGKHLHASRCAYADVEKDSERFTILHDYTDGCASTVGDYGLSLFGPRAVNTLLGGQTLIIRDVEAELSPKDGGDMFTAIGIHAIITCPLVKDGGLRAMMAVHQTAPRDWQPSEITIVQDVVERCWATIERRTAEESIHKLNAELELRVIERTAQLEAANKELEAFSYSVSHDLRAPLRAVDGFSQAVIEDYGPQLPEEGGRYLQMIREGAQRMGALIDDLLEFARLSRQLLDKRTVDTESLVQGVLEDLASQQKGRQIEIRKDRLPACMGDPALLKQVWVNLLSNALKYTRKRERTVLEIGCVQEKEQAIYFVRDNGTGFDMQYAHKLFGVFHRLHRAEDYEGTGVGLAIVQRVIQRHGGRVWAEAEVNRGATFYFTLDRGSNS